MQVRVRFQINRYVSLPEGPEEERGRKSGPSRKGTGRKKKGGRGVTKGSGGGIGKTEKLFKLLLR